jgi:hypothetical protein
MQRLLVDAGDDPGTVVAVGIDGELDAAGRGWKIASEAMMALGRVTCCGSIGRFVTFRYKPYGLVLEQDADQITSAVTI